MLVRPGYASWIGKYAERNAVLVDILESLGAVLFVKTNIPQTLMVRFGWGSLVFCTYIYCIPPNSGQKPTTLCLDER